MMKLGETGRGKSQLSFALLFMSIRAFSNKKNYLNFSLHVGGGTSNLQGGAIYASGDGGTVTLTISNTEFKSNTVTYGSVSEILTVVRERNLVTFLACPGAGTGNLLGWRYFCRRWDRCQDLLMYF